MIYLILFFVVIPIIEIAILIKVGTYIGTSSAVLVIVLTGVLGSVLTRLQGFIILQKINERLSSGIMPSQEILDGALVLIGGLCLLAPGMIGDAIGLTLLIPWTRLLVRKALTFFIRGRIDKGQTITIIPIRRYSEPEI
jgi:UPF0716 protein FxsA